MSRRLRLVVHANFLSAAFHKYGDAPRAARRPPRKARGARIPRVFDRRATPRGGMHRRPNATVFMKVSTKRSGQPRRRDAPLRGLLERIRDLDQAGLAAGRAGEADAEGRRADV